MPTVTRQNSHGNKGAKVAINVTATPGLDLNHIADQLRHLAVECAVLVPDPDNARKHGDANLRAIKASLMSFGQLKPVVVRKGTNVVVAGNGTLEAARALGWTHIAAVVKEMTDLEARAYGIADNRTAELAEWDYERLGASLHVMQNEQMDLAQHGWGQKHLNSIINNEWSDIDAADSVPLPPDTAISHPGDVWILGDHRLMCGDSSKPDDVDVLVDGQRMHMINTDPPYNVKVEPRSNNAIAAGLSSFTNTSAADRLKDDHGNAAFDKARCKSGVAHHQSLDLKRHPGKAKATHNQMRAKDRPLANDFVSDDEFERLLLAWFGNMSRVTAPGGAFYIWGGYANVANYPPALKAAGLYFSQSIIWDKQHPVLTRKDFMGAHEWCQPPETKVLTNSGTSCMNGLRDGDRVVSFYQHSSAIVGLRDGMHIQVATRNYDGPLYGVNVAGRTSWSTDGHMWTVRTTGDWDQKYCVYLMRTGSWWRVGATKMRTTWGMGLKMRMMYEGGDEGWILSVHDSASEARIQEQYVSVVYGIPQTCWTDSMMKNRRKRSQIEGLYERLGDLEPNTTRALDAHNRNRLYPFLTRGPSTRVKVGSRQSLQVRACNLLPGLMKLPVPCGGQATEWMPVRHIDVQPYHGRVMSLAVENHHHYIADGLVTHNCFYGWKEGAGHKYYGPNNATDLWHVKKVNPQNMEHLTEKPVELAVRAITYSSLRGQNVIDLFGGSGSTMIGAEHTGRRAFLMELDPLYCDVIVSRFIRFTDRLQDVKLLRGGRQMTYEEARDLRDLQMKKAAKAATTTGTGTGTGTAASKK